MSLFIHLCPILLFICLYVGSGLYFSSQGVENAFYQVSPTFAILPALALAWALLKEDTQTRMNRFLDGVRHRDIITMCLIFLLAGAFSTVTKAIGSADSTIHLALNFISPQFLLIGLFLTTSFIATAIGTSMGAVATLGPIAAGLASQGAFPLELAMATVVGGAMFGDNLSIISDTTIASIMSQGANLQEKLKINIKVAAIAFAITVIILFFAHDHTMILETRPYSWMLITPYIFLILLASFGVNVFISLVFALVWSGIIGFWHSGYDIFHFGRDIVSGFQSMHEIMLLSLLVGGLSGLTYKGSEALIASLNKFSSTRFGKRAGQLLIAKIVSIFDILLANNTIAIIFSGEVAKEIAKKYHIPSHYSASWLHIFSCVFQGIIPYGAQILLASSIAGVSPLSLISQVYYCYALGIVAVLYILFNRKL
ncbi:MAG: Na+/H+ antiporter NhaC family protein [Janthinobacterium lividum]